MKPKPLKRLKGVEQPKKRRRPTRPEASQPDPQRPIESRGPNSGKPPLPAGPRIGLPSPGIQRTEGVCGGDPCIRRTRIPVWALEQARRLGFTEAEFLDSYPTLRAQDLVNAWAYVKAHRAEMDRQIHENESA